MVCATRHVFMAASWLPRRPASWVCSAVPSASESLHRQCEWALTIPPDSVTSALALPQDLERAVLTSLQWHVDVSQPLRGAKYVGHT